MRWVRMLRSSTSRQLTTASNSELGFDRLLCHPAVASLDHGDRLAQALVERGGAGATRILCRELPRYFEVKGTSGRRQAWRRGTTTETTARRPGLTFGSRSRSQGTAPTWS